MYSTFCSKEKKKRKKKKKKEKGIHDCEINPF